MLVYNTKKWPADRPCVVGRFFGCEKVPRSARPLQAPLANVLFALMADGVAVDKLTYPT